MEKNDGGPAFPSTHEEKRTMGGKGWPLKNVTIQVFSHGMSLRDKFADSAIKLFPFDKENIKQLQAGGQPQHELVAKYCYELADAMLAERER